MTLNTLRKRFVKSRMDRETGSDLVVTLFMIPFVLGLVFALIDVSSYFQVRAHVENVTRDGARQVALYGGSSSTIPLNVQKTGGQDVTAIVKSKLWRDGKCTFSACSAQPTVTCGPALATSLNQDAFCTTTYNYSTVGGALVEWLGFKGLLETQIKITESFKVETRY